MNHLLIDADLLLYKAAIGSEFSCDWGGNNWVLSANLDQAKDTILARLNGMKEHFNPAGYTLVRSDRENFRKQLFPEYKGDRSDTRKPIIFNQLLEWLDEEHGCLHYPKLEADDTLGILHTSSLYSCDTIIISEDKDMLTIPGKLYRGGELITVTPEQAKYHHMYQTLTGDSTDGYSGCPGIGPKTAEKLLNRPWSWSTIVETYEKAGLTEADALLNARMAYILQAHNWKDNEVILWSPPSSK